MKYVSIVLNLYNPHLEVLKKVLVALEKQKTLLRKDLIIVEKKISPDISNLIKHFSHHGKMNIQRVAVEEGISFASSMNYGIKKAKGKIVVVVQQDCIPSSKNWLENLTSPFGDSNVIATVSKVNFPDSLWNNLDKFTQAMIIKEKGTITPLMDEKGCAYRLNIIKKVGLFNEKDHKTAGEDFDMYVKLKNAGKIVYPNSTIIHYHPTNFSKRLRKSAQFAEGDGVLVKKIGTNMPDWYFRILKSLPIIGFFAVAARYPFRKNISLYPFYLAISPALHATYSINFWKGFLSGKQKIDVFARSNNYFNRT